MSNSKNVLVAIPDEKGVHTKTAGAKGERYVYVYTKYFRNAEKKPRNRSKAIGKCTADPGMMIPNAYYYERFKVDRTLPYVNVYDFGYIYLVLKIAGDIELLPALSSVFGTQALDIIAMAAYIIREGNAMDGMEDWQARNFFPGYDHWITSYDASRIFSSLVPEKRHSFFEKWVALSCKNGSVCYDVTSVSSYSENMPEVERGYNRDKEDLCQFNLGMFCDEDTQVPIYYNRYNGSLTDKTNLFYVLENAKAVGIKHVKFFMDGGFWSEECIKSLACSCEAFTMGMPAFLTESGNSIERCRRDIEQYSNEVRGRGIYCMQYQASVYGVIGKILVYYDPWNHANLCNELSSYIGRLETELGALKRYPKSKLKRYVQFFTITQHESDSGFEYAVDYDKVEAIRKNKGFFLLFSTDMAADPATLLDYYRAKDADEKIFAQIKDYMDGNRIRTHNEQTTDGKVFVTFIACIIRSFMLGKLRKYLSENSTSMKKVLNQLSNILVIENRNDGLRLTKALTKKQKAILACFNADKEILKEFQ